MLQYFKKVLAWSGIEPLVTVSNPAVTARLHKSADHLYLWALNTSAHKQRVSIRISPAQGTFSIGIRQSGAVLMASLLITPWMSRFPPRMGLVLQLES